MNVFLPSPKMSGYTVRTYIDGKPQRFYKTDTHPDPQELLQTCDGYSVVDVATQKKEVHLKMLYGTCLDHRRYTHNYDVLVKEHEGCSFSKRTPIASSKLGVSYTVTHTYSSGDVIVSFY